MTSFDASVMDAAAVARVEEWNRKGFGTYSTMTNGQWMEKVTTERLRSEYSGLFRMFGLPMTDGEPTPTNDVIAHDHYARADRIAYELLRRGEWLN